jgi:hypothetical protein
MTMSEHRCSLLAVLLLAGGAIEADVHGQVARPPAGGPNWQSIGPPLGDSDDFLGVWKVTWDGPMDSNCPCHGMLTIEVKTTADGTGFAGYWEKKGSTAVLQGAVGVDQNVWVGHYAVPNDTSDFPEKGNFRLEARGGHTLTGSYQRQGMTIPFRMTGTRN